MIYTEEQRLIRDRSVWTRVQAVLAPAQFALFLVSLALVLHFLATGQGYGAATASIVLKTVLLYTIMITGAVWEKEVFGQYLFAQAFFWEDVVSIAVLVLHTAYLAGLVSGWPAEFLIATALCAYAVYLINAAQFLLKLLAASRHDCVNEGGLQNG